MGVENLACDVCGGKLNRDNQRGVCRKKPECRSEYKRRYHADNKDKISKQRKAIYYADPDKTRERDRRYREASKAHPRYSSMCEECGESFGTQRRTTRYCSVACRNKANPRNAALRTAKCGFCGEKFQSKRSGAMYCSRECNNRAAYAVRYPPILPRECEYCGEIYQPVKKSARYCGKECQGKAWYDRNYTPIIPVMITVACEYCEMKFQAWRTTRKYCSKRCDFYAHPDRWARSHKARAERYGVEYEGDIDRLEILDRDNWVCHICSRPIGQSYVWPDGRMGSMDHVVPVSKGGPHTSDNLKAAHLICNIQKSNRLSLVMSAQSLLDIKSLTATGAVRFQVAIGGELGDMEQHRRKWFRPSL